MGDITTGFVRQYGDTLMLLSQQKGSRLRSAVMVKSGVVGKSTSMDQLGKTTAQKKTTRNGDTPISQPNLQRRWINLFDYEVAQLHDKEDQLKMLIDPTSGYVMNNANALGRSMDDEIIDAAFGTSYAGEEGDTTITFPAGQQIPAGGTGLDIPKILAARELFEANDVDENEEKFMVVTSNQITDLLNTTEVKSSDFNAVQALAKGQIDSFCGFKFIRTERLDVDGASARRCIAFARSGLGLAIAKDIESRVTERADKSYAKQVYACLGIGATRVEEEKVVEVLCVE